MKSPKVSVIVPNYNYGKYIEQAIESVLSQTYKNIEIIVVDDGSTDNSLEVLERYRNKITLITQKNQGVSAARNNGVRASSGEYIAFLDPDDVWLPTKIEKQVSKMLSDNQIGLVHCAMIIVDEKNNPIKIHDGGMEGLLRNDILLLEKGAIVGAGSTCLVKRHIFEEIDGFDLSLSTSADWDFCYRASLKCKIGFIKEPLALYRVHNSSMHSNIQTMEKDMSIALKKALSLSKADKETSRRAYGNLYYMLAGSYFYSGNYTSFIRNMIKAIVYRPNHILKILRKIPMKIQRKKKI
jgi:glycosyltransferase involved in cell wall biosynthesis